MKLSDLQAGDLIRNLGSGNAYQVIKMISGVPLVMQQPITATNPTEWIKIDKYGQMIGEFNQQ